MSLAVVGLNHRSGSVELLERLGFSANELPRALRDLRNRADGAGVVILSTCNRVELYLHHAQMDSASLCAHARALLAEWHAIPESEFGDALYAFHGQDAITHLFRVASSLDSLVVGESQILGQVHDAYLAARTEQATDKVMHALFQKAFSVAKAVRSRTDIGAGNISISSVAVDLAASIFMELSNKTVMVLGAGEMSELTLKSLHSRGVGSILVLNRSIERAREIAARFDGEPIAFADLDRHLHRADILISSTAAPHAILHPAQFRDALERRAQEPMFVIDIAVPRDVEPEAGDLDNLYLYNMDDLRQVVEENLSARREQAERGAAIVERGADEFAKWLRAIVAEPTIVSMARELRAIREQELEKTLAALPDLTEKQRQEVGYLTERIVNKILQSPMTQIKHEIGHHDPYTVLHLVRRLFGLKD
ncbi:MAG: glutamyl-tRNA reductase [Candidatus Hydrogenedentes bacterium]|nr:glutamyl-tRNA reductase [Candidatus Hydrogenedentota bacterium]